ncbi:MAG: replication-associated recombination protein A [Christensenellaceae bacterium]|jgi:putative ATPase|nr:replication-associated recombination protein A [Christensenellaceae bacterium]
MGNEFNTPLAVRMRPQTLNEYVGQEHLVGRDKILRKLIDADNVPSMIFWGPAGVGKTTLARIIANTTKAEFVNFSAVGGSIKEVRTVMEKAEKSRRYGIKTIVFVDEIHRFNKAQQDAFLPFVENGSITLIGATTENPSFEVNSALLSRCKVFILRQLTTGNIKELITRAIADYEKNEKVKIEMNENLREIIADFCNGDGRTALNLIEMILNSAEAVDARITISDELVTQCTNRKISLYDKKGEEHYNTISALHKSMRNSDPQAGVYWLMRMLDGGEDPLYIARRLVRFASEDIGLADSNALLLSVSVYNACHYLGMPECGVHLVHAVVYLSLAPKSNSLYVAHNEALADIQKYPNAPVPLHIRNGVTKLMKEVGYGRGYQYAHDYKNKITDMECLPENLVGRQYYSPTNQGKEPAFAETMERIQKMRKGQKK